MKETFRRAKFYNKEKIAEIIRDINQANDTEIPEDEYSSIEISIWYNNKPERQKDGSMKYSTKYGTWGIKNGNAELIEEGIGSKKILKGLEKIADEVEIESEILIF